MTPQENEKIKLMQLMKQGKISTLPDVDSDKYKASKIKDMMSKEEGVDEVSSQEGSRIEGLLDIEIKNKILDLGDDLIQDLLKYDEFFIDDIVNHLAMELKKNYNKKSSLGAEVNDLEEETVSEGDSIVDESEFNFFQTLAGEQYSEEEIEKYLQSDEYQEELQYSQLEMSDTDNWLNDMFEYFNKRKSLDEGLDYFARIAGLKKIK